MEISGISKKVFFLAFFILFFSFGHSQGIIDTGYGNCSMNNYTLTCCPQGFVIIKIEII